MVDNYGNRYAAETLVTTDPSRYFFYKEAIKFDILKLNLPPLTPSWMVFDETCAPRSPSPQWASPRPGSTFVPWTKDNLDAVKRGWIMKADTIEGLAAKIKAHNENRNMMVPENLVKTVARFNEFSPRRARTMILTARQGHSRLSRNPRLTPLPLYAGGPNTKGGIAANAKREVLDWAGKPIPRLLRPVRFRRH